VSLIVCQSSVTFGFLSQTTSGGIKSTAIPQKMLSRAHGVASLASRFQNRLWYMAGMVRRVLGLRQMHNPVFLDWNHTVRGKRSSLGS
jgi:hypothetical protein